MTLLALKSYQQAALGALRAFARAAQPKGPALALGEQVGRPYNPDSFGTVVRGSGRAARRLFAANSPAIGKKSNAADRPSPRHHRPQGVMQRVPRGQFYTLLA